MKIANLWTPLAISHLRSLTVIAGDMAFEIHGGMEHTNDLEKIIICPEEDDVFALGGDSATWEKIRSQAAAGGIGAE